MMISGFSLGYILGISLGWTGTCSLVGYVYVGQEPLRLVEPYIIIHIVGVAHLKIKRKRTDATGKVRIVSSKYNSFLVCNVPCLVLSCLVEINKERKKENERHGMAPES